MECKHIFDMNLDEIEDDKIYAYYPTSQHQRDDSKWWAHGSFIKMYRQEAQEYGEKLRQHMMWGKPKEKE